MRLHRRRPDSALGYPASTCNIHEQRDPLAKPAKQNGALVEAVKSVPIPRSLLLILHMHSMTLPVQYFLLTTYGAHMGRLGEGCRARAQCSQRDTLRLLKPESRFWFDDFLFHSFLPGCAEVNYLQDTMSSIVNRSVAASVKFLSGSEAGWPSYPCHRDTQASPRSELPPRRQRTDAEGTSH